MGYIEFHIKLDTYIVFLKSYKVYNLKSYLIYYLLISTKKTFLSDQLKAHKYMNIHVYYC